MSNPESRPEFKAAQIQREADLLTNPAKRIITKASMAEVTNLSEYRIGREFRHMSDEELAREGKRLADEGEFLFNEAMNCADQAAAIEAEKLRRGGFLDAPEGLPDGAA